MCKENAIFFYNSYVEIVKFGLILTYLTLSGGNGREGGRGGENIFGENAPHDPL